MSQMSESNPLVQVIDQNAQILESNSSASYSPDCANVEKQSTTASYSPDCANVILRLHYVPGGHGGHVSDNREQNGITVRQRRGT